ncbi:VOC family protein [Candidatus Microgenomates bacterium]|nr:VOC family protein [Candidatus Microgenomates bacterium]
MSRVVHFEIHADDTVRAKAFYEAVFNWKIEKWGGVEEYYLITTGDESEPGINGGIMKRKAPVTEESVMAYVCTIDVTAETIDTTLTKVESNGGALVVPKTAVPRVGYLAYCKDPDGNVFGLMEANENAV